MKRTHTFILIIVVLIQIHPVVSVKGLIKSENTFSTQALSSTSQQNRTIQLFDGRNTDSWIGIRGKTLQEDGWKIEGKNLVLEPGKKDGDLITKLEFSNFELNFEFKLTKGANTGIKYFVNQVADIKTGKKVWIGLEYQIIDDYNHETIMGDVYSKTSTGSLYKLYPPNSNKKLKKYGKWNKGKIKSKDGMVEHWLNGKLILKYQLGSKDFFERIKPSGFLTYFPDFGTYTKGHIMLQNHNDAVSFRNISITTKENNK